MAWALRAETHTSAVGSCLPGVSELGERVPGGLGHSILDGPVWAPASPPSPQPPSSCSLRSLQVSPCTCVVQDQPNVEGEFLHRLPGFPLCGSSLFCGCLPTKPSYLSPELWSLPHLSRRPSAICLGSTSPYCGLGNLSRRKVWVDVGLTLCVFPLKDHSPTMENTMQCLHTAVFFICPGFIVVYGRRAKPSSILLGCSASEAPSLQSSTSCSRLQTALDWNLCPYNCHPSFMGFSLETHLSFYSGMVQQSPGDRAFIFPQPGWGPSMPGLSYLRFKGMACGWRVLCSREPLSTPGGQVRYEWSRSYLHSQEEWIGWDVHTHVSSCWVCVHPPWVGH